MNSLDIICLVIAAGACIASVITICLNRRKTERILERIDDMLNKEKNGTFHEEHFDETKISALETKFVDFLCASEVSTRNLKEEKDKIKELISDISHQTKTPIANILLYSQLLSEQVLTEEARTCVDELNIHAENLSFLINMLVKTSRLETGVFTLQPVMNDVDELINEVCEKILKKAKEKNIRLNIPQNLDFTAVFDMKWTTEAVYNIMDNAVKYTPSGKSVTIKCSQYDMFCRIEIIDEGIGIREEEHSKIFQRFYRSSDVRDKEGTGIGLFLSRKIISKEGGYLKVASTKGRGSAFSAYLPMNP